MSEKPMTSMIADAFNAAVEIGAANSSANFEPTYEIQRHDEGQSYYLSRLSPDAPATIEAVPRPRLSVSVRLDTLASFAAFVAEPPAAFRLADPPLISVEPEEAVISFPRANPSVSPVRMPVGRVGDFLEELPRPYRGETVGAPVVRVVPGQVVARYNVDGYEQQHVVSMPLAYAEAYLALTEIINGVTQKRLWTLLATDLQGCFPDAYEMIISGLSHLEKTSQDVDIQRSGITNVTATRSLELVYKSATSGEQKREIEIDWVYQGPLWTCFDLPIEIPCRLVISKEGFGLCFQLFPRGLEALLLQHRAALTVELANQIAGHGASLPIYEGRV